jgi:ferredoxin-NADP reductase/ferredoxin
MLKIKVFNSQKPTELKELDLKPETMLNRKCLIGRRRNCGLVLNGAEVSRLHGKIFLKDGNYYFADLASSRGSWINGENAKVNQGYLLKVDDIIRIGGFVLTIVGVASADEPTVVVPIEQPVAIVEPHQLQWWTKGELTVRCVRVIDETVDVKTFCFVANPPVLFTYKPGQFVTLELEINLEQVLRSYSISSTPSRPHTLEITVKRVPPPPGSAADIPSGLVSNWLHENITVGSEIKLSGPIGKFTCFANPCQKMLMLSAGSGITPMMSMARWIGDTASDCDIVFFHSARSPRDIIFRQELELMSARYANFNLAITTTRKEPGQSWLGLTGRLTAAMLQSVAPDFMERTVYVCGPNTFMEAVKEMLEGLGFPMQNYYEESFGPSRKQKPQPAEAKTQSALNDTLSTHGGLREWLGKLLPTVPALADSFGGGDSTVPEPVVALQALTSSTSTPCQLTVVFSKSGKEVTCDGEEPILNLAEIEGIKIRSNCRFGACGACKKLKLEGEVKMKDYDPEILEESERQQGYILTCISYPLGRVVIDA